MTTKALYEELNYVNHSREKRLHYAKLILDHPEMLPELLEILFMVDDKISARAGWVFEFLCDHQLEAAIPYLDLFTSEMHKVHLDSAVRPVAKVCEYLVKAYYSKVEHPIQSALLLKHRERIIEACFDWLIGDQKIAAKVYAMSSLFFLGLDFDWIHPELKLILERDYAAQSAGFKSRARRTIKKIDFLNREKKYRS